MFRWAARFVAALLAALVAGCLGAVSHAQAFGVPAASVQTYVYDGQHQTSQTNDTTHERGPPGDISRAADYDAVDRGSRGVSARSSGTSLRPIYDYDIQRQLVQAASVALATERAIQVALAAASSPPRSEVAANGAADVPAFARSQYSRMSTSQRAGALEKSPMCPYCGTRPSTQGDHITSLKRDWESGGWADDRITRSTRVNSSDNLIGACQPCNGSKGAREIGPGVGQWWPSGWPSGTWWTFGGP